MLDESNACLNISAYNGGLFALDLALDAPHVPDEFCAHSKDLGDYDSRPAQEVADAAESTAVRSVIDVDIVGQALGNVLNQRFEKVRRQHESEATGTARKALANPNAYDLTALHDPQPKVLKPCPALVRRRLFVRFFSLDTTARPT